MADNAHNETDEKLAEMEEHLSAIYEEASKDIEAKAQEYFDRFKEQDEKMRKKVEQGEMTEDEYIAWRRKKILTGENWKKRQQYIASQYEHVNEIALAYINGKMPEIYVLNYNYSAEKISSAVKAAITIEPISADVIKAFADKHKTFLPLKTVNHRKYQRWCTQKINSAVLQGIFQGESVSTMAKRLESVTRMDKEAALRNARTMVTSAECKGRQDSYEQAQKDGIQIEREWIATNDRRTRHAHVYLDGKTAAVDEPFETKVQVNKTTFVTDKIMYPGDTNALPANVYNCRCTIAAKVIGFKKGI